MNVASAVSFVWDTKPDFPSKSWSGVLLKERESMWWSWKVVVEVESRSASVERDSNFGFGP